MAFQGARWSDKMNTEIPWLIGFMLDPTNVNGYTKYEQDLMTISGCKEVTSWAPNFSQYVFISLQSAIGSWKINIETP